MKNIDSAINGLLGDFTDKQRKVLDERFGFSGKQLTLQAIGDDLGVTRERIRQIEGQGIQRIRPAIRTEFSDLFEAATSLLGNMGGVRRDDYFVQDIKNLGLVIGEDNFDNKLRFILIVGSPMSLHKESDDVHSFWHLDSDSKQGLFDILGQTEKYFKSTDKSAILDDKLHLEEFDELTLNNFLPISKKFGTNVFGDFGLRDWPEIEPKVIRDKAYLVLRQEGKPLHFRNIASKIQETGIDKVGVHTQTVHNEVIKDDRFVLVGRGLYALKEHGYDGGTVREVIKRILKDQGPMHQQDVLRLVSQKKILKDNTILLNLQNRSHFRRMDDGRYHIR